VIIHSSIVEVKKKREEILENRDNHVSSTDQGKGYRTKETRRPPIRNADFLWEQN
jgi:hypothetical protein